MSEETKGVYEEEDNSPSEFFSSGCTLVNCTLGGGWALGRTSQIYGESQTGKSAEGIEAAANFRIAYPKGVIKLVDAESAFEEDYARSIGFPEDGQFLAKGEILTVEALCHLIEKTVVEIKKLNQPGLIIVDSLDGLSDESELKADISDGSYNMKKQKKMNELFRRLISNMKQSRLHVMFISQLKEKVGIVYGSKDYTTAGKAIEYFASQRLKLKHCGFVKPVKKGITRVTGVSIKAICTKNRLGPSFRECEFDLIFGQGINSVQASVNWLASIRII